MVKMVMTKIKNWQVPYQMSTKRGCATCHAPNYYCHLHSVSEVSVFLLSVSYVVSIMLRVASFDGHLPILAGVRTFRPVDVSVRTFRPGHFGSGRFGQHSSSLPLHVMLLFIFTPFSYLVNKLCLSFSFFLCLSLFLSLLDK